MEIKAKIYVAQQANEEALVELRAATAHLAVGNLREVDAHLALAAEAFDRAHRLVIAARRRAATLSSRGPTEDESHHEPPAASDDRSITKEAAGVGVS